MRIEPHYVTFEQAKLLNEKGFNEECVRFYVKSNSKIFGIDEHGRYYPIKNKPKELWVVGNVAVQNVKNIILAPEQWQVVEWLRVNHNLFITTDVQFKKDVVSYWWIIKGGRKINLNSKLVNKYNSPQEATSAAFDYVLKKLI